MRSCLTLLLLVFVPAAGSAQEPAAVPQGLKTDAFPTAYVLDDRGVETQGKLLRLDAKSVVLLIDGMQREFELSAVSRVSQRGDSLKNGAITGAVVGVVLGLLSAAVVECRDDDGGYGGCPGMGRVGIVLFSTAFYTAVGTGIDAAIPGRRVLYQAPPRSASLAFRISW